MEWASDISFVSPEALDACQAAGLKAIVMDPRTAGYDWRNVDEATARKNVTSLVDEVGKHPAVFGYYLRDEPGKVGERERHDVNTQGGRRQQKADHDLVQAEGLKRGRGS